MYNGVNNIKRIQMSKEKVTIQDIADSLNLSRNTVSKALNGNDSIPESTKNRIIKKTVELKYKQFAFINNENLSIHIIRQAEIDALILPNNFELKNVDGIVCIELFNKAYTQLINNLGLPTIFIDCTALKLDLSFCITEDDKFPYVSPDWINSKLDAMDKLPSAFVHVNDFVAVGLVKALKNKNIKIPEDILVTGFDDSHESSIIDPHLTTVHIYSNEMGTIAADLI